MTTVQTENNMVETKVKEELSTQPNLVPGEKLEEPATAPDHTLMDIDTKPEVTEEPQAEPVSLSEPKETVQETAHPDTESIRTEVAEVVEEESEIAAEPSPELTKEQFKWYSQMLRNMKKKKDAVLFLQPVDPIALNIPTYFTVITSPMDISTIEKNISSNHYKNIKEVLSDTNLMFQNCFTFNGEASAVSLMAKNLQQWYIRECEKMPKSLAELEMRKKKKPLLQHSSRESLDNRPKRDSFADGSKRKLLSKKGMAEMKFCNYVHRELTKKQFAHFVWPFMTPVDPDALGIPHYRDQIKNPMDLSTVRKKLDLAEYNTAEDFEADVRLMLNNCFSFNTAGTDIYNLGKQLETLFNSKWAEKATFLSQHGETQREYTEDDEDGDDEDLQHIQMLKTQLALLTQQMNSLIDKRKRRQRSRQNQGIPKEKKKVKSDRKKKKRGFESEDEAMPVGDITYEQKRELSDNINILPSDKLPQVFEIIKENTQLTAAENEEIELDIDSLAKDVLWKLYLFVKKHTRPPKRAKYEDGNEHTMGAASSSSDGSGSDDSDDYSDHRAFNLSMHGIIKGKPLKIKKSKTAEKPPSGPQGPMKPIFKQTKPRPPKVSNPKEKKKAASPLPFRTEIGDTTNYTNKFKVLPQVKKHIPIVQKPKYDSVLDSAWDDLESLQKPETKSELEEKDHPPKDLDEIKPKPEISFKQVVREELMYTYTEDYDEEENEPIDMQGPADLVNEFSDSVGEVPDELHEQREIFMLKCMEDVEGMSTGDWVLNNDQARYESDEDGAY